jgi:LysM repeat protein
MSNSQHNTQTTEGTVLSGLVPTPRIPTAADRQAALRDSGKISRSLLATMPIILVGSMAVSMNLTGPIERVEAKSPNDNKAQDKSQDEKTAAPATTVNDAGVPAAPAEATPAGELATAAAPATYRVAAGDTVSSIAGRYGLSTASVLALNGLGWKSTIFPGQTLKLVAGASAATPVAAAPAPAAPSASSGRYTIVKGDTISRIASRLGVSTQSILSANGLSATSIIYPGQTLAIPGASSTPVAAAPVAATPAAPAPVKATPAPVASAGSYVIQSGDTISRIAAKFGISTQALLSANSLSISSVIYAGRTLVIPGASAPAAAPAAPAAAPGGVTLLNAEMEANARVIISVGQSLGVSEYGIVIALSAAMQESSLRNINYGHLDSLGLFQQRPSSGWGTAAQLTDPAHAARLFYGGPSNPNKGITRGLLEISGWQSMTVTQAAQKVQISAYPDAYAKWETSARFWLADLT